MSTHSPEGFWQTIKFIVIMGGYVFRWPLGIIAALVILYGVAKFGSFIF